MAKSDQSGVSRNGQCLAIAVMKYFPELDETQKGHMMQNKKELQSTNWIEDEQETHMVFLPQTQVDEISVNIKDMKNSMYTNQTGQSQ